MKSKNSLLSNYQSFLAKIDSKRSILLIIAFLIIIGSFLRVYGLNKVFTEYDDIGVVSIHKGHVGSKTINFLEGFVDYQLEVDMESAHSIENSMLLPFYIGYTWTYAPAQYIFLPLLLNESDEYDVVVFKGRLISAFFSIMSILLMTYLMYLLNGKALNWIIPIVLSIPIFSANSILYAHHMSPYSAYFFSTSLGLVLLYHYFISTMSLRRLIIALSLLLYLSYLTVLFALPVLLIYLHKLRVNSHLISLRKYKTDVISVLMGLVIAIPGLVLMKINSGGGSTISLDFSSTNSIMNMIYYFIRQLYVSMESIFYGLIRHDYLLIVLFIITGFLFIKKLVIGRKNLNNSQVYVFSILFIFFQWLIFHFFGLLPLDQTRHMLVILPLATIAMFFAFKDFQIQGRGVFFAILVISIISFSASLYSIDLIKSKYSNFNYNFLDDREEKVILLYRSTIGPMKYYEQSEKEVYFIDMNSFQKHYTEIDFPDEILLVSQQTQIFNEGLYDKYKDLIPGLFCNYSIKTLYEKNSETFFTYNNYESSSNRNGMFVYEMKKVKDSQC